MRTQPLRILPLALAFLVAAAVVPTATQAQATIGYAIRPAGGTTALSVDLQGAPANIQFTLDTAEYALANVDGVVVRLANGQEQLQVQLQSPAAQGVAGTVWRGTLSSAHRDLTKAVHNVTAHVASAGSSSLADTRARTLTATATESVVPVINASLASSDRKVRLGPEEDLGLLVDDRAPSSGLRAVTYRIPGTTTTLPLEFPYAVRSGSFREGTQSVIVNATDRAGNKASVNFTVIVDTQAPDLVITTPQRIFVGVPAPITVLASDTNAYNVTFIEGGRSVSSPGPGPSKTHTYSIKADRTGLVSLTVQARDILGNAVERAFTIPSEILSTDSVLERVEVTPARPIAGEAMSLRIRVAQDPGQAPLGMNVTWSGAVAGRGNLTVPVAGGAELLVPVRVPVGTQTIRARVDAPAGVVELNSTDQEASATFEVFFAKVVDGNDTYYIRANSFGIPSAAVTEAGASFPLRIVQEGRSIAYEFTANGEVLEWDPTPDGNTTQSQTATKGSKGSPGLAPLLGGLALLAVALVRRR